MAIFQAHNLFNPEEVNLITENEFDTSREILNYGKGNDIPQQLINSIDGSLSGTSCVSTIVDFIRGNGLSIPEIGEMKANSKGQTLDEVHDEESADIGYFDGVAFRVQYNNKFEKIGLYPMPFEEVRIGTVTPEGKIENYVHNPYFGTSDGQDKKFDTKYYPYDPSPDVIKKQIKDAGLDEETKKTLYKGQVLYKIVPRPGKRFYPLPQYASGIDWFETENKIARFHNTNISNNFMLSAMMVIKGDPERPTEQDKDGNTIQTASEALDDAMSELFSGNDNAGKIFTMWVQSEEDAPTIDAFPNNTNDELFTTLQKLTTENISIASNVPPVLANIMTSGKLGNVQELLNAIDLMQKRVVKKQQMLSKCYYELTKNLKVEGSQAVPKEFEGDKDAFNISKFNPLNSIKDQIWDVLTEEEKRTFASDNLDIKLEEKTIDQEESNQQKEAEARANLRGSVGGVTALVDIVTKVKEGLIEKTVALAILQETYGYTAEQAGRIVSGVEEEKTTGGGQGVG